VEVQVFALAFLVALAEGAGEVEVPPSKGSLVPVLLVEDKEVVVVVAEKVAF